MLTDEQYGDQLGGRLRHAMADVQAAPDLVWKLRRQQARRTWAIRTAVVTPVAAAVAVTALVMTVGRGAPGGNHQAGGTPRPTGSSPVRLHSVAYVQEQTIQALSRADEYVLFSRQASGGRYDVWMDKATHRYRLDLYGTEVATSVRRGDNGSVKVVVPQPQAGQTPGPVHLMESISVRGAEGDQRTVTVQYDLKKWWTGRSTDETATEVPDITDPDSIREAIADSKVELLGRERVDGHETLALRFSPANVGLRFDMWVGSGNYLPVQEIVYRSADGMAAQPVSTTKYSWLPRTKENLARLTVTPPPGFQRVN